MQIKVIDPISRSEHKVEPRQFEGRLLHEISKESKLYLEIYLNSHHSGNVVVINSGHRDFVYASCNKALQLRYISRLFSRELVLRNFAGLPQDQVLERLIELSLYTEEHLK